MKKKIKYFHASPKRFKIGTVLHGGEWFVFMTHGEALHYTIAEDARKNGWHIYEVKPQGKLHYGKCWDEAIADYAVVVRYVGTARGVAKGKVSKAILLKDLNYLTNGGALRDQWNFYGVTRP